MTDQRSGTASPDRAVVGWGVTMTWWYTVASLAAFEAALLVGWAYGEETAVRPDPAWAGLGFLVAGLVWLGAGVTLLVAYRRSGQEESPRWWAGPVGPGLGCLVAGLGLAAATAEPAVGVTVAGQTLTLTRWRPGARKQVALVATLVVALAWSLGEPGPGLALPPGDPVVLLSLLLPFVSASALWWWDIVEELDRARAAEGRLAATQERLRVAGDVHDLQGHHFQVIALQLELAERLLTRDPAAAMDQVRAARASVDEARRGTRALAMRFRGVPLPDELANAADLMRAAGLEVSVEVDHDADEAPAEVLGPVVRESTTNVLKHGGRAWARLRLGRADDGWTYRISNDRDTGTPSDDAAPAEGSGLAGIAERVGEVGGNARVDRTDDTFEVVVTVPGAAG